MNEQPNPYAAPRSVAIAAQAGVSERTAFIRSTYSHLFLAIVAFVGLEALLLNLPGIDAVVNSMIGGRWSWLIVLGAFMLVSYVADRWARSATSRGMQYAGLGLYVIAQALITLPLIYIAMRMGGPGSAGVLPIAAGITLAVFAALTGIVFVWKADFSFLRGILAVGGLVAMGVIVASILFGFQLGILFSGLMVGFASAAILYKTSNVLHHYRTDQPVSAALALFASVALLFWYVLRLVMAFGGRN